MVLTGDEILTNRCLELRAEVDSLHSATWGKSENYSLGSICALNNNFDGALMQTSSWDG